MKVLRLHNLGDLRLHDEPNPVAGSNEYLLRVTAVGNVCRYIRVRTDWSYVGTPYETHLPACHSDGEKRHCGLI